MNSKKKNNKIAPLSKILLKGLLSQSGRNPFNKILYLKNFMTYGILGDTVRIEVSSRCQLRCPQCTTGIRRNKKGIIGWGNLEFKNFRKIIDNNRWIKNIELSNYGELFLNPELEMIIKYACKKKVSLRVDNGTNLNNIDERMIQLLVRYKIKHLLVSIDGASEETYKIYRRGGNFNKVIENINKINYYKRMYKSKYPKLSWQFIIFGHNEHELPIAKKIAKKLNMKFIPRLNGQPLYSPIKNKKFVKKKTGIKISSSSEKKEKRKVSFCHQLWSSPQVNWDGKLLGCCLNKYSDFGNVFEKGLRYCLKSEKYIYAKKMLIGKKPSRKDIPCVKCPAYIDNV